MVRAQQQRYDGAILGLRHLALGDRLAAAGTLQWLPAVEIVGEAAPGISTGTAMDMMEKLAAQLPTGFGLGMDRHVLPGTPLWRSRRPCAISLLVVFSLAALYESWSVPFSVMLVVPLG